LVIVMIWMFIAPQRSISKGFVLCVALLGGD
jgi:hypothetical protein